MNIADAVFSVDRKYRYVLIRIWDSDKPMVNFIGLNPSTADEIKDDPTMRRCCNFAKSWGYGGFYMTNLFAYKATKPEELKKAADPIGQDNDKWLLEIEKKVELVVFAWGVHGKFLNRDYQVINIISQGHFIELSKDGVPKHPLYLKGDLKTKPYVLDK
jgi:hypothetical protein